MSSTPVQWIVSGNQCVPGLGRGELLQSTADPSRFQFRILLNSYESNCLRDWLAFRWKLESLEQTSFCLDHGSALTITLNVSIPHVNDAKPFFENWLESVLKDREQQALLRK